MAEAWLKTTRAASSVLGRDANLIAAKCLRLPLHYYKMTVAEEGEEKRLSLDVRQELGYETAVVALSANRDVRRSARHGMLPLSTRRDF
jgi:hypothetical protein